MKTARSSNIELLRIITICGVVVPRMDYPSDLPPSGKTLAKIGRYTIPNCTERGII